MPPPLGTATEEVHQGVRVVFGCRDHVQHHLRVKPN
jgi:hypothetical protein